MLVAAVSLDPVRKPCVFLWFQTVTHLCSFPDASVTAPVRRCVITDHGGPRAVLHAALKPRHDFASAVSSQSSLGRHEG